MSPYIVTTKRRDRFDVMGPDRDEWTVLCHRAVATLEEARGKVDAAIRLYVKDGDDFARWIWASESLPESGGTVGPLPDGTVIEVAEADWGVLILAAGFDPNDGTTEYTEPQTLDAFNARQL